MHGAADSVRNGVTTVCNMSQALGSGAIGQLAAARRGPGRTVHVEGLAADLSEAQRRERIEALAAESADADRVLGLAVDVSDWGMDVPAMARESALVAGLGLTTHTHYLEDPTVAHLGRARFADLVAGGRIAPGLVVAHFIHTTPEIVRETARRGAAMVWNPLSNGRLGSGLPDVLAYREAGLPIGLGLDGQASADLSDPFENMRMGLYAVRMRAQDAGVLLAADVLRMHTIDAARALGVGDLVGSLEPGKLADFVVVDAEGPATGPVGEDLLAHLVLACSARDIRSVHVGGRAVAVDGTESADGAGSASGIGSVSGMGSEWRDLRDRVRRILAG